MHNFKVQNILISLSDSVQNERIIVLESSFEKLAFFSKSKDKKNICRRKYQGNLLYELRSPVLKKYTFYTINNHTHIIRIFKWPYIHKGKVFWSRWDICIFFLNTKYFYQWFPNKITIAISALETIQGTVRIYQFSR